MTCMWESIAVPAFVGNILKKFSGTCPLSEAPLSLFLVYHQTLTGFNDMSSYCQVPLWCFRTAHNVGIYWRSCSAGSYKITDGPVCANKQHFHLQWSAADVDYNQTLSLP